METSQELTFKFMVALASNSSYADTQKNISEEALKIYTMAKTLTHLYLEKVA
jgi:hypothetical protein